MELSKEKYEAGDWAPSVQQAWERGKEKKAWKRSVGEDGKRRKEGQHIASYVVGWVKEWQKADKETRNVQRSVVEENPNI